MSDSNPLRDAPVRIMCVDDNDLVCDALQRKFTDLDGFEWVGRLPDASGLMDAARASRPHVILMDLDMPGPKALEAIKRLAEALPSSRVLVLSGLLTPQLVDQVFEAGAWGYLSKDVSSPQIIDAARRVAAGDTVQSFEVQMACGSRRADRAVR